MFCPQCGSTQSDDVRFCKSCGGNLFAVRQAVAIRETDQKFDWSKTWVAEMFLSDAERRRRNDELDRLRGFTPEKKRERELKNGIVTACVGIGVSVFLAILMEGIIAGTNLPRGAAEILSRLWVAGVIPFFVGVALIINGLFVGRGSKPNSLHGVQENQGDFRIKGVETSEFMPPGSSVTEDTTRQLKE